VIVAPPALRTTSTIGADARRSIQSASFERSIGPVHAASRTAQVAGGLSIRARGLGAAGSGSGLGSGDAALGAGAALASLDALGTGAARGTPPLTSASGASSWCALGVGARSQPTATSTPRRSANRMLGDGARAGATGQSLAGAVGHLRALRDQARQGVGARR
jgi:hypothetical protein